MSEAKSDPYLTMESAKRAVRENHCPACGAAPGDACRGIGGIAALPVPHLGRFHIGRVKAEA